MAITQVRAQINGTWYTLTATGTAGQYTAQITAPGATSYNQPGGYYNVTVEATNTAGTTGSADASTLEGLKFYVEERVAPVITILSPSDGAYVSNNQQPVVFTVTDESGGSGVDLDSVVVKLDGTAVSAAEVTHTAITNGYSFTYTPSAAMGDGAHTVSVEAADNDGNAAAAKSTTFTVDTVPPALNVTSPAEGLVTATAALAVSGTTNDATSSPVVITVTLNSADQGPGDRAGERRVLQDGHAGRGREHHRRHGDRRGRQGVDGHTERHAGYLGTADRFRRNHTQSRRRRRYRHHYGCRSVVQPMAEPVLWFG